MSEYFSSPTAARRDTYQAQTSGGSVDYDYDKVQVQASANDDDAKVDSVVDDVHDDGYVEADSEPDQTIDDSQVSFPLLAFVPIRLEPLKQSNL